MENKQRFHALTGLKGIFIFIIVFFHTLPMTPLIDKIPFTSFINNYGGTFGNYMFFMLSGFLISYGYRDRIMAKSISFKDFVAKRLYKLYPLYIITNAAMLLLEIVQYGLSAINLKKIAFTVLLQAGGGLDSEYPYNGPTWFVSALFVCYIAYFFLAFHSQNRTHYYCMIAIGIIAGYTLHCNNFSLPFCYRQNGDSLMNFFIGCALEEIFTNIKQEYHKWLKPSSVFILCASGFLLMRYGVETIAGSSTVAFAFILCPFILYLSLQEGLFSKFLQLKPILYLGKISVSIYFWHFVLYLLYRYLYQLATQNQALQEPQYLGYLALLIAGSILSYRYIENRNHKRTVLHD